MELSKLNHYEIGYELKSVKAYVNSKTGRLSMNFTGVEIGSGNFNISVHPVFNSHLMQIEGMNTINNYFTHSLNTYICKYTSNLNFAGFTTENYVYVDSNSDIHKFVYYKTKEGLDYYCDESAGSLVLTVNNSSSNNKYELIDDYQNKHIFNNQGKLVSIKAGVNNNIHKVINYNSNGQIVEVYDNRNNLKKIQFIYSNNKLTEIKNDIFTFVITYNENSQITLITKTRGTSFKKLYEFKYYDNSNLEYVLDHSSLEALFFEYENQKVNKVTKKIMKEEFINEANSYYLGDDIYCNENYFLGETYLSNKVYEFTTLEENTIEYNDSYFILSNDRNVKTINYFNTDYELINSLRIENDNEYYTASNIYGFDMLDLTSNDLSILKNDMLINGKNYLRLRYSHIDSTQELIDFLNERDYNDSNTKSPYYKAVSMVRLSNCNNREIKARINYFYKENENSTVEKNASTVEVILQKTSQEVWQLVEIPIYFEKNNLIITRFSMEFINASESTIDVAYLYLSKGNLSALCYSNEDLLFKIDRIEFRKNNESSNDFVLVNKNNYMSFSDIEKTFRNMYKSKMFQEDTYDLVLCDGRKRIETSYVYLVYNNESFTLSLNINNKASISFVSAYSEENDKNIRSNTMLKFSQTDDDVILIRIENIKKINDDINFIVSSGNVNEEKHYNEFGVLIEEVDTNGNKTVKGYDEYGNPIYRKITNDGTDVYYESYQYYGNSPETNTRISAILSGEMRTEYAYNENNDLIRYKKNDHIKCYNYDYFLDTIKNIVFIDKNNNTQETYILNYDKFGNLSSITNKSTGNKHLLKYNDLNMLDSVYKDDIQKEEYQYTLNQAQAYSSGEFIKNCDIVQKNVYGNSTIYPYVNKEYYDKFGNLRVKTNANKGCIYKYNQFNELIEIIDPYTALTHTIEYNEFSGIPSLTIKDDNDLNILEKIIWNNNHIQYKYKDNTVKTLENIYEEKNSKYRLVKTIDKDSTFSSSEKDFEYEMDYNNRGQIKKLEASLNNSTVDFTKEIKYNDSKDKISEINHFTYRSEMGDTYQYDSYDKLTSINESYDYINYNGASYVGNNSVTYTYDDMNRLISENNSKFGDIIYEYGDNNDISKVKEQNGLTLKSFQYRNDRLVYASGLGEITYDNYGNMISIGDTNLQYDTRNLLSSVFKQVNNTLVKEYYYYDYQGIRYKKTTVKNGQTLITEYTYDGNKILKETTKDSSGNIIREFKYFYNSQGVCGLRYNNVNYTFVRDILGNVRKILKGEYVICDYWYDAWGNQEINYLGLNSSSHDYIVAYYNPFRYRGYYYDVETQLYWVSSRYYSPELCRWISPDSIEYLDPSSINGLNLYCYCLNNPIFYCDPSGHSVILPMLIGVVIYAKVGVGVGQASNTSDKLGITGWKKFWYSVSGIFVGDFLVSLNNWGKISQTIMMNPDDEYNFKFDQNPFYSFWNAPLYAIHLKNNQYKDEGSRTTLGLYLELQAHYLFYLIGNEHATDGADMGPTDGDSTGKLFELLASAVRNTIKRLRPKIL